MMTSETDDVKPIQFDRGNLSKLLSEIQTLTKLVESLLSASIKLHIERRNNSLLQVEMEQSKLEKHKRLYPTMQRQLQQLEMNVADWQEMTKTCITNNKKLFSFITDFIATLSNAPIWIVTGCFSAQMQKAVNAIKPLHNLHLNENVQVKLDNIVRFFVASKIWTLDVVMKCIQSNIISQQVSEHDASLWTSTKSSLEKAGLSINGRISIWWADDKRAYDGVLVKPHDFFKTKLLQVNYDDGDVRKYTLTRLIMRALRAQSPEKHINAELRRLNTGCQIGSEATMFVYKTQKIVRGKVSVASRTCIAFSTETGTHVMSVEDFATNIKITNKIIDYSKKLRNSVNVDIGRRCIFFGVDQKIYTAQISAERRTLRTVEKLTLTYKNQYSEEKAYFHVDELIARITQARISKGFVGTPLTSNTFDADVNQMHTHSLATPPVSLQATAPKLDHATDHSVTNLKLKESGLNIQIGSKVSIWCGSNHENPIQRVTVKTPAHSSGNSKEEICLVLESGETFSTCSISRMQSLIQTGDHYLKSIQAFQIPHLRGYIVPGKTLQIWSPARNQCLSAILSLQDFEQGTGQFRLESLDGTVSHFTAEKLVRNISHAAAVQVDTKLAANGITNVSCVAGSTTSVWLGASKGMDTVTLKAGFTSDDTIRVLLQKNIPDPMAKSGSQFSPLTVQTCTIPQLIACIQKAEIIQNSKRELERRGLRIGGPIDIWWAGDKRSYRGVLQLEANFYTTEKLTVRYDDGDIRHYDISTLLVRDINNKINMAQ